MFIIMDNEKMVIIIYYYDDDPVWNLISSSRETPSSASW